MRTHAADGGLGARPLAVAEVAADIEILFATSRVSPKVAEIAADPRVLVTCKNRAQFVCVADIARASRNRARLQELRSESRRI